VEVLTAPPNFKRLQEQRESNIEGREEASQKVGNTGKCPEIESS